MLARLTNVYFHKTIRNLLEEKEDFFLYPWVPTYIPPPIQKRSAFLRGKKLIIKVFLQVEKLNECAWNFFILEELAKKRYFYPQIPTLHYFVFFLFIDHMCTNILTCILLH